MTRAEWEALIQRIEAAEGPDRELDADIHLALHPEHLVAPWQRGVPAWQSHIFFHAAKQWTIEARRYTDSLDAAVSLVPEGHVWTLATWWCDDDRWPPYYADCASGRIKNGEEVFVHEGRAATPALALTAAAMRARMALEGEG